MAGDGLAIAFSGGSARVDFEFEREASAEMNPIETLLDQAKIETEKSKRKLTPNELALLLAWGNRTITGAAAAKVLGIATSAYANAYLYALAGRALRNGQVVEAKSGANDGK